MEPFDQELERAIMMEEKAIRGAFMHGKNSRKVTANGRGLYFLFKYIT